MASISRRLLSHTRQSPSRVTSQCTVARYTPQWQRSLSTTPPLRADKPTKDKTAAELAQLVANLKSTEPEAIEEAKRKGYQGFSLTDKDLSLSPEDFQVTQPTGGKLGFWAEGEESMGPDEEYFADDLTSLGHGELEQHRELREYARLIAWELPLLSQLARPFEPPTDATPFRFRYTSYLGEKHPAVNKVVVEFTTVDMKLLPTQRDKLIKLAGVRYNPDTDVIKMSCEKFDTQAQNKRFLGETISKLLSEAKDGKDTFEDIPFDFRHHKPKVRHEFPKDWILTPERKQYLEEKRAKSLISDDEKLNRGLLIDGQKVIESSMSFTPAPEPAMVGGARGKTLR